MTTLTVYLPKPGTDIAERIRAKSAILGEAKADRMVRISFEGNVNGAVNLREFYSRAVVAAGRLVTEYPTIAAALVRQEDLIPVGSYDADRHVFTEVTNPAALEAWAGEPIENIVGVRVGLGRRATDQGGDMPKAFSQMSQLSRGPSGTFYRTRAGQIIEVVSPEVIVVFNHDDHEIVEKLSWCLDENRLAYAVGPDAQVSRPTMH